MPTTWNKALDFGSKVAVITGGSGVLFSALAEALGAQGAAVVVVGHAHLERAQAVVDRATHVIITACAVFVNGIGGISSW